MAATADPDPAIALAAGLAVFGLPPGEKRPEPGWQRRCSSDPAVVAATWRPGDNVGIGCRASRLLGIDLDRHPGKPDGIAQFQAVCDRYGQPWPDTYTVRTPRGGLHLYLRVPDGRIIGSTSGGRSPLGPSIDTRGPGRHTGGHLVGPGSRIGGVPYVVIRDVSIAPVPEWIADLLALPTAAPAATA
ncbi:bifunctional DNA primase/polymerase [Krasilnikovia cinnamomea]|nr:bifunctional DNA primase/polymerase [Krasilnikovia cinnamomea]